MKKLLMVLGVAALLLACVAIATAGIHPALQHRSASAQQTRANPPLQPPAVSGLQDQGLRVALPWVEDFEGGDAGWTTSGFFHVQADPEAIQVLNPTINPRLVTLPDAGFLPAAHSGNHTMWYGESVTGTFIGADFDPGQDALSGGTSAHSNNGYAITPSLDLTGATSAQLSFWSWWEIEGVDVNAYDMMFVYASSNGTDWTLIGTLNPLDDVNAAANVGYSSGGVGAPGVWQHQQFDVSAFVGGTAWIAFQFDTRDPLYNGFRGWLVDDINVTSDAIAAPTITEVVPNSGQVGDLVTVIGTNFQNGAQITIGGLPTTESIQSSTHAQVIVPGLPGPGSYDVMLTNPDGQFATCNDCFSITSVLGPEVISVDPPEQYEGPGINVAIHGEHFDVAATVTVGGLPATGVGVANPSLINCTVPNNLPVGFHAVRVQNPDGQFDVCVGCFQVVTSPCHFDYDGVDQGDLMATYPTLPNNPGHALTGIAWLGNAVDGEATPHLYPGTDIFHDADAAVSPDLADDGVGFFGDSWMPCTMVSCIVQVTAGPNYPAYTECGGHLYLNAWKDGNADFSFDDVLCEGQAPEWIIQDAVVTPGYHVYTFRDPGVFDLNRYAGVFRFRLTHTPIGQYGYGLADPNAPGSVNGTFGFDNVLGEDEDYVVCDLQLAVELSSFNATAGDNAVALSWNTASESKNDHFEIERDHQLLARVNSQGNDATGHHYSFTDESAVNGTLYGYTLFAVDVNGNREELRSTMATPSATTGAVTAYSLRQNYPNPFNPTTAITFDILDNGFVSLKVYNLMGQQVATLVNRNLSAGRHTISFDGANLPSGVYLYRLEANNFSAEKKMLLMK